MSYYSHTDKQSGDGLALTDWNDLSNAVAGNQGLTLALNSDNRIGIGITNPTAKVHIVYKEEDSSGTGTLRLGSSGSNLRLGYHKDYSWIQSHGSKPLRINERGNDTIFNLTTSGKVGIGTASPSQKLEVDGTIKGTEFIGGGAGLTSLDASNITSGTLSAELIPSLDASKIGDGTLTVTNGNVGISTTNPTAKLDVEGSIKVFGDSPIKFVRYTTELDEDEIGQVNHDTGYSATDYSAAIVGFSAKGGDIYEGGDVAGKYIVQVYMSVIDNKWYIRADFHTHSDEHEEWHVDVMFVRKELSSRSGY